MAKPLIYISIGVLVAAGGVGAGIGLVQFLKPTVTTYLVDTVTIDYDLARSEYAKAKGNGDFSSMREDLAVQMGFLRLAEEEQHYSFTIGSTVASIVTQSISNRNVSDGSRHFEESNSEGLVNLHNRMFYTGTTVDTYFGESSDYGSHPKKSYSPDEYREWMGRLPSDPLVYVIAPETLAKENKSGDPDTSISIFEDGYKIELELDPRTAVSAYQKQMQAISDLKYKPTFEFCHLTVYTDANLDLRKMVIHEKYMATTSAGVGSMAEADLTIAYFHNTLPEYGFPNPGDKLPDLPKSVD